MKRKWIVSILLLALLVRPGFGAMDGVPSVDEIVRKANHVSLYQGTGMKGRVKLVITDKQGRTRERTLNILRRDSGTCDRDQKYMTYFLAPADVRKMVFMVHKHTAPGQDDDRWLYMPAMDLVKRIASSDKRTSFVGSDFLYEDISGRNIDEDIHELIRATETRYIIKNTPKKTGTVAFDYYIVHVDRDTFLPVRTEFYRNGNTLYRIMEAVRVDHIKARENGRDAVYPTVIRSEVRNLESGSRTSMTLSNIEYNIGMGDKIFSERYLRRPPREVMR